MTKDKRIWLAVAPALVLPFIASLFYFVIIEPGPVAKVIYGCIKLFTLIWPVLAFLFILKKPIPRPTREQIFHSASLSFGVISGLVVVLAGFLLLKTPFGAVVRDGAPFIYERVVALGVLPYFFWFTIFISIFHSGLEEYYWRWFVYGKLSEVLPSRSAHLVAALGFASHHVVILSTYFTLWAAFVFGAMVALGGLMWSLAYQKQKTLIGAWISHMIVDFGIMAIGYALLMEHSASL